MLTNNKINIYNFINREDLYNFIIKEISNVNNRLLIVERTPAIIEKNIEKYKINYIKKLYDIINKNITFIYLFNLQDTRNLLYLFSPDERLYARTIIYKLKKIQKNKNNKFRFDPCKKENLQPILIIDNKILLFIINNIYYIISIEDKKIADDLFNLYLASDIIDDDLQLSSMLDLEYKDTEKVLIVDKDDNLLGLMPRKLAHAKKLLHRGIIVEIYCNDKILMAKRSTIKRIEAGKWDASVSGHCIPSDFDGKELLDGYKECALREIKEELGLSINKNLLNVGGKYLVNTNSGETAIIQLFQIYFKDCNIINKIKINEEIEEYRLIDKYELSRLYIMKKVTDWYSIILERSNKVGGVRYEQDN